MPLNLDDYTKKQEEITFGGEKFVLSPDIPANYIMAFMDFEKDKFNSEQYEKIKDLLKKIFEISNDKDKVNNFIESLPIPHLIKIITFISNYVNQDMIEEKKKNV